MATRLPKCLVSRRLNVVFLTPTLGAADGGARGWRCPRMAVPADAGGGRSVCVFQSAIEPKHLWSEILDRHHRALTGTESRVLALLFQGYRNEEAAFLMQVTAATVRRHVADLCHKVFDLTDIPQEREKLRTWAGEHFACCIPLVKEMIENDRKLA